LPEGGCTGLPLRRVGTVHPPGVKSQHFWPQTGRMQQKCAISMGRNVGPIRALGAGRETRPETRFTPAGSRGRPCARTPGASRRAPKRRRKYFENGRRRHAGNVRRPTEKCASETSPLKKVGPRRMGRKFWESIAARSRQPEGAQGPRPGPRGASGEPVGRRNHQNREREPEEGPEPEGGPKRGKRNREPRQRRGPAEKGDHANGGPQQKEKRAERPGGPKARKAPKRTSESGVSPSRGVRRRVAIRRRCSTG
jgi:hypothetical protein